MSTSPEETSSKVVADLPLDATQDATKEEGSDDVVKRPRTRQAANSSSSPPPEKTLMGLAMVLEEEGLWYAIPKQQNLKEDWKTCKCSWMYLIPSGGSNNSGSSTFRHPQHPDTPMHWFRHEVNATSTIYSSARLGLVYFYGTEDPANDPMTTRYVWGLDEDDHKEMQRLYAEFMLREAKVKQAESEKAALDLKEKEKLDAEARAADEAAKAKESQMAAASAELLSKSNALKLQQLRSYLTTQAFVAVVGPDGSATTTSGATSYVYIDATMTSATSSDKIDLTIATQEQSSSSPLFASPTLHVHVTITSPSIKAMSPLAADVLTQFGLSGGDGKWFVGQSRSGEALPPPTTVKFLVSVNSSNLSKVVRSTTQEDEAGVCAPSLAADAVQGISAVDGTVLWPLLGDAPPLFVAHTIIVPTQPTTVIARTAPPAATTTTAAVAAGTSSQRRPDNRPRKGNGWGGRRVKGVSSAKKKNNRDESDDDEDESSDSSDEDEDSKPLATQYLKAAAAPSKRPRETDSTNRRSRVPHVRGTLDTAHSVVASNHKTTSGTSPATAPGTTTEVSTTTNSGGVRPATTLQSLLQRAQDERVRMPQS